MTDRDRRFWAKFGRTLIHLGCGFYKWVSPGQNGVPDRICLIPGGRIVFVELKTSRGNLRPEQHVQIKRLRRLGFRTVVIYGEHEADEFVREVRYWIGKGGEDR